MAELTYVIKYDQKYENLDDNFKGDVYIKYNDFYIKYNKKRDMRVMKYQINSDKVNVESHWHDWIEFTLVMNGEQEIIVEGKANNLSTGDFLMIHQSVIHEATLRNSCAKKTLQIKESHLKENFPMIDLSKINCNTTTISTLEEYYKYKDLINIYENMIELFSKDDPESEIGLQGLLYLFMYKLNLNFKVKNDERNTVDSQHNQILTKMVSYINLHYQETIKLEDLSNQFNISKQYIARVFKSGMNCTFKEFLTDVRVKHAEYDIVHTNKALLDICMESGFPNYQSFLKIIKEKNNINPSDFRKEKK